MPSTRSLLGVGPKLALVTLPALILAIVATVLARDVCRLPLPGRNLEIALGAAWLAVGLVFYGSSARRLLRDFHRGKLIVEGTFSWSQNPLYASFIVFLIPAAALLADSWPLLAVSLVLYLGFRRFIGEEYRELEATFGESYRVYRSRTSELVPLPPRDAFGAKAVETTRSTSAR